MVSNTSISTAKILITLGDMSSCQGALIKTFFSTYLQFLLGEMVSVLLLGVWNVRVVDIDQIDKMDHGSGGNR